MIEHYLKERRAQILTEILFLLIFTGVSLLYEELRPACLYADALCLFFGLLFLSVGYYRYSQKMAELQEMSDHILQEESHAPEAAGAMEQEYQQMIVSLQECLRQERLQMDRGRTEMTEYYTMWVHQIKTPIAALRLLLQDDVRPDRNEMKMELMQIEEYVEMVLQYLRTDSEQTDFLFTRCSLDAIIREAIKKNSLVFIRKKLKLQYETIRQEVLTDEKWLSFIIGQVLSNALKYTRSGSISIYMDPERPQTLVIEDTGIGIRTEDIPRVFDRGFTGYNGRNDKKSTGIGLYLCKKAAAGIGSTISIESEPGKGTKVRIGIEKRDIQAE